MSEKIQMLKAARHFERYIWDGCMNKDCLPSCSHKEPYRCAQFERACKHWLEAQKTSRLPFTYTPSRGSAR